MYPSGVQGTIGPQDGGHDSVKCTRSIKKKLPEPCDYCQRKYRSYPSLKFTEAPRITKSIQMGVEVLKLKHPWVIYPGQYIYPMDKKITALPIKDTSALVDQMGRK